MDSRLLNTCRYTGIKRTTENEDDFVQCHECQGYTHKTLGSTVRATYDLTKENKVNSETVDIPPDDLLAREGKRCSHCGSTLE